jgi:hypothetical protein
MDTFQKRNADKDADALVLRFLRYHTTGYFSLTPGLDLPSFENLEGLPREKLKYPVVCTATRFKSSYLNKLCNLYP